MIVSVDHGVNAKTSTTWKNLYCTIHHEEVGNNNKHLAACGASGPGQEAKAEMILLYL